jgi:GT2 family glycosyltransferase
MPDASKDGIAPLVSVVVPTFQRRHAVERLLDAMAVQTLTAFEVVICVDGSTDGTLEMLTERPPDHRVRWISQPNRGRAAACNAGIGLARSPLVVFLDDDMEPVPTLLEEHLAAHRPGIRQCVMGAVPVVLPPHPAPHVAYIARKFAHHLDALAVPSHRFVLRDFYSGNCSLRREDVVEVGLFDETFSRYGNEDLELAHRLMAAKVHLGFSGSAKAHQHYEKSLEQLVRDEIDKGHTAVLFVTMHPPALGQLKLGALESDRWSARARRLLAGWASRSGHFPALAVAVLRHAQRLGARGSDRLHKVVLDFCYLGGAASARRGVEPQGSGAMGPGGRAPTPPENIG